MDWKTACQEMLDMYGSVFGNNHMFLIFLACLIILFITDREKRKTFLLPSLFLVILILNPVCYVFIWKKFLKYAYWRTFWMIPVIPVIAYTIVHLMMRAKEKAAGAAAVVLFLLLIVQGASDVYTGNETGFTDAPNTYKLPQEVIAVADALLELDDEPYAIVDPNLNVYMREYTSKIHMLYGRDAYGYIAKMDRRRRKVVKLLSEEKPDLKRLHKYMKHQGYPYYVRWNDRDTEVGLVDFYDAGFTVASEIGNYTIYFLDDVQAGVSY